MHVKSCSVKLHNVVIWGCLQLKCKAGSGFYLIKVGVFIISIIISSSIYLFLYGLHRSLSILHSCACHRFACVFLMQRTQALHMC